MPDYYIAQIRPGDIRGSQALDLLLQAEGIRRDANLDYTCGMFDHEGSLIATGSCFGNTLRCLAVSSSHQGEGLMNQIVTHLMEVQVGRCNTHLFLYTKCGSAKFFEDLGFYEIARVENQVVFMENRRNGFTDYLGRLKAETAQAAQDGPSGEPLPQIGSTGELLPQIGPTGEPLPQIGSTGEPFAQRGAAAIVMNANPFTLGHQYLVEQAAACNELVHLFIVSEDASLVPFSVRERLVKEGTAHIRNVCCHSSGPYIISSATFPSYFQKDEEAVIESHARLDLAVFRRIAEALGITRRYVGEEPTSQVTGIYNQIMEEQLPNAGIECIIVPRKTACGKAISASAVRKAVKEKDTELLAGLVPESTLRYFLSSEAEDVVGRIQAAENVIHY